MFGKCRAFFFIACLLIGQGVGQQRSAQRVLPGIDVLLQDHLEILRNKRVGLITNPTGITQQGKSTIDVLFAHSEVQLVALFGPEHGVRGTRTAGAFVPSYVDEHTNLPVYSLYGNTRKPTSTMLNQVDILVFDIQDVGVRPYTYTSTMVYAMQAAAEMDIPFVVLDRPNPMGGIQVEGPVLDERYTSFIGLYPIPYVHGMTIGELARLFNNEFKIGADLTVIPLHNWSREQTFDQTGLLWVPSSPHVPHASTPFYLATTGAIGELHSVNEGVGYTTPFECIAAEWINRRALAHQLNALPLDGVFFREITYKPYYGAKQGQVLHGVHIHITGPQTFHPMHTQLAILHTLYRLYPEQTIFNPERLDMFFKAMGTDAVYHAILQGEDLPSLYRTANSGVASFLKIRSAYVLY